MPNPVSIQTQPAPSCPSCGAKPMVLRTRKSDGKKFWGCHLYPECRGTRNILEDGTPETDSDIDDSDPPWGHGIDSWDEY